MDKPSLPPIATLTLNPCLDVSYEFSSLVADQKVQVDHTRFDPGGNGINVGRALKRLGLAATNCCLLAGEIGNLADLHATLGLRDVILEEDQMYEPEANDYVLGITDTLRADLCLRANVLTGIRTLNSQLAAAAGNDDSILAELDNLRLSLDYYWAGNRIWIGPPEGTVWSAPIREDVITHNIEHLLGELDGAPALAFFGGAHVMKSEGIESRVPGLQGWAHRLTDSGVEIYALRAWSLSGRSYWRGAESDLTGDGSQVQFADGSSLATVLETAPDAAIVYVDLLSKAHASTRLGEPFLDVPARSVYDGLVVFREAQPMEHTCP